MSALKRIAAQNKEAVEAQGYSEINLYTKECRVMNNLIDAVNVKYNTAWPVINRVAWNQMDQYLKTGVVPNDEPYPVFFKDCDVRSVPNIVDASLSYKEELIALWFVPSWMADIVTLVGPAVYRRADVLVHWDEAVDAFHAGLQGDLDTVGAFIGGMVLMAEARNGL